MIPLLVSAALAADPCLACHEERTPAVIAPWKASAHRGAGVTCAVCHGDSPDANHAADRIRVSAAVCGKCHADQARQHAASRHGIGFRAGQGCTRNLPRTPVLLSQCTSCHESDSAEPRTRAECARFLGQSAEMQRQGCTACHKVEERCDTCHLPHSTDLGVARDPAICSTCHMGPDHPQWEMWQTSKHGVLHERLGPAVAPDCARCHMPGGTHDVSTGISMGLSGQPLPEDVRKKQRDAMIDVCDDCHTAAFATRELADGDAVQKQSKALVDRAAAVIEALDRDGLLLPAPGDRPPHPLSGHRLELGSQMVYQDLSGPEALFFRMKKFDYVIAYKGVFHQNPDYAHWYGNAPLKLDLSEIESEARLLRAMARLEERVELIAGRAFPAEGQGLRGELRALQERYLRGELDAPAYEAEKKRILDEAGL